MGLPIYDNIDRLLKENGMSRRQLALKAGIGEGTMSTAFARRSTMFHPTNLQKIADTLGVTVDELKSEPVDITPTRKPGENAANWPQSHPYHAFSVEECAAMINEINENVIKLKPKHLYFTNEYIRERLILQQQEDAAKKEKSPDTEASEE